MLFSYPLMPNTFVSFSVTHFTLDVAESRPPDKRPIPKDPHIRKKKKKREREEIIPIRYVERKLPLVVVVVFEGRQLIISFLKLQSL